MDRLTYRSAVYQITGAPPAKWLTAERTTLDVFFQVGRSIGAAVIYIQRARARKGAGRKLVAALAMVGILSGCASSLTQGKLDLAVSDCRKGDTDQCNNVPLWQEQVNAEANRNAAIVAVGILGALAGAADAASGPRYYHHHYRR